MGCRLGLGGRWPFPGGCQLDVPRTFREGGQARFAWCYRVPVARLRRVGGAGRREAAVGGFSSQGFRFRTHRARGVRCDCIVG